MENTSEIFKLIESADNLFQQGSIKEGQKLTRDINFQLKQLQSIPRKLLHKVNFIRAQSRYFDDISSFAANPKREKLIKEATKFVENTPNKGLTKYMIFNQDGNGLIIVLDQPQENNGQNLVKL